MTKKYTPATFQPTVRPAWAGILSYISDTEKATILEAIIKYPNEIDIQSKFWFETIKPDLDEQYNKFVETCQQRGRGAKTYWGEHKLSLCNTYDEHKVNLLKDKDKDKNKDKDNLEKGIREKPLSEEETLFDEFWKLYIPVKCKDGRYTEKGSKKEAFKSFCKALKVDSYENIKNGLERYLKMKAESNSMTANVSTFLNQERWKDDYEQSFILTEQECKKSNFQKTKEMMNRLMNEDWS